MDSHLSILIDQRTSNLKLNSINRIFQIKSNLTVKADSIQFYDSKKIKVKKSKKMIFYFLALSSLSDTSCQFITFHQAET